MKRSKITILSNALYFQKGGIQNYLKNVLKYLTKLNYQELTTKDAPFSWIPFSRSIYLYFEIKKLLPKNESVVIWQPNHLFPFTVRKKQKLVLTIHDLSATKFPKLHPFKHVLFHKLFLKKSIKQADLILTPSEFSKQEILNTYKTTTSIRIVHGGLPEHPVIERPNFKIPDKYFVFVGAIEPRKNLPTLIKAHANTYTKTNHQLLLIGPSGWKNRSIFKLVKKHSNCVQYLNYLPTPYKNYLIQNATALVFPSFYEGFGLPPLEAMQLGTPTITSDTSSLKELYEGYSLQFNPFNQPQLERHLLSISQDPQLREVLKQKGLQYSQQFRWKKSAEQISNFLYNLAKTP